MSHVLRLALKFRSTDGSPRYTTAWIPLTDATPNNSCLYVVPRHADPGYGSNEDGRGRLAKFSVSSCEILASLVVKEIAEKILWMRC